MENINMLTDQEKTFCDIYVNGCAPFAGNAWKCYSDVFPEKNDKSKSEAIKFLNQPHIKQYIEDLEALNAFEAKRKREYIARHLENIIEETSTSIYTDRKGKALSPAALRSVSVQAMKLYADLYPVREAQVNKLNIESNGGGITFNVIVPNQNKNKEDD